MTGNGNKTANRAILALTAISVLGIMAGIVAIAYQAEAGAILAVVSGAVGGIVAIVLRQKQNGGEK
jgi:membrane associated rhomboid family serine protease